MLRAINLTAPGHLSASFTLMCDTHIQSCAKPFMSSWQKFPDTFLKFLYLPQLVFESYLTYQLMSLEEKVYVAFLNHCPLCPCALPCILEPSLLLFHPLTTVSPWHSSCSTEHSPRLTYAPHGCSASLPQQCSTGHLWLPGEGPVGKAFLNGT